VNSQPDVYIESRQSINPGINKIKVIGKGKAIHAQAWTGP
jgi:hypothetical protein